MAKPANCISVTEARTLQTNWRSTRAVEIEAAQGSKDACDFVFSVDELQEFIDYVKDLSTKQGINSPGIRVYFAAYDDDQSDKATVFLAPTKDVTADADNNYSIDPLNRGQTGWPPNNY